MSRDELPKLIQDILYAQEHCLLDDQVGYAAMEVVGAGVADAFVRSLIRERVQRHKISQAFVGPFRIPNLNGGELVAGIDTRGRSIRFPIQYLNGHSYCLGGSGCGKTTRALFFALQVAPTVKGLWWFDLRKQEGRKLQPYLSRLGIDLILLPARKLRLNPLQIPDQVNPIDWAPRVADMLVQVLRLPPRATKLLHGTILTLYSKFGVFVGGRSYPTLFDLREKIAADRKANPQAKHAAVDGLDPVLMSIGSVLCYRFGWTTHELANRPIVFEFGGVSEVDKDLLLNSLILPEFTSRVAQGVSNKPMDLWLSCDEAQRIASGASSSMSFSDLLGLVRGTGIGVDLSTQSSFDVAPQIFSNTENKFIGRCGSAKDYDAIGSAMGLTADQRRWLSMHLTPGLFVGQVGQGEHRYPFLFRVPAMKLKAMPKAAGISDRLGDLDSLPVLRGI